MAEQSQTLKGCNTAMSDARKQQAKWFFSLLGLAVIVLGAALSFGAVSIGTNAKQETKIERNEKDIHSIHEKLDTIITEVRK